MTDFYLKMNVLRIKKREMRYLKLFILLVVLSSINHTGLSQAFEGSFDSKFNRYQKGDVFVGENSKTWNDVAWKGERIHKQIILWSDIGASGISYNISDLAGASGTIPSSAIRLRFGKNIKGDAEALTCSSYASGHSSGLEIADALSDTEVNIIDSADPLKVWITVNVPNLTLSGIYSGSITISDSSGSLVFDINLEVVDYELPLVADWEFHLDLWQFPVKILDHYNAVNPNNKFTIWSDEHFSLFEPGYRLLAETGQKAITTYIKGNALGAESMVKWTNKADDSWEYDFTVFDKYVSALMSWGITKQIDCFSPVGWNEEEIPYWDEATNSMSNLIAPVGTTVYNERWDHFLTAFKTHLDTKGWFDKTVLYLDEVEQDKLDNVFTMVQNNNASWKIGIAHTKVLSTENSDQLYDASGILGTTATTGRSGKVTTFYTSCTQTRPNSYVSPQSSVAEMVWMGWHSTKEGLNGYLRWAYDYWQLTDPFDARDGGHTAGDFSMVYRSSNNSPVTYLSSLRLVMLREGIQDFEKLKILKASLESSPIPYNKELLAALNDQINNFGSTTGVGAELLVKKGQKAIKEIVLGTLSYCKVDNGGANTDYYVKSLTSIGAIDNLNFSTNEYPTTGYEHHTGSRTRVLPGDNFTMSLGNSPEANRARTKVWIDWNDDEDFDDVGEEVFSGGDQGSYSNSLSYSIPIAVPTDIDQGIKRMRIQVRESNEDEPESCGTLEKTGTTDFDIEVFIIDEYCIAQEESVLENYYVIGLTTTGGIDDNINFVGNGFPLNGYEHHTATKIATEIGDSFVINLENASSANCARTGIWIDWNNDKDFDDTGEQVYNDGTFRSCANTTSRTINVQVPNNAVNGKMRMRVRLRNSWLEKPEACGTLEKTGTADFDIEISEKVILKVKHNNLGTFVIYPNPSTQRLISVTGLGNLKTQITVSLFNLKGQMEYNEQFEVLNSKDSISFHFSKKGVFLMRVDDGINHFSQKIILLAEDE